ncbi:Uncharacterised protein [Vibrio cholerae]|nr:Uncharacterised protein [Vibrio cholerae]
MRFIRTKQRNFCDIITFANNKTDFASAATRFTYFIFYTSLVTHILILLRLNLLTHNGAILVLSLGLCHKNGLLLRI